MQTIHLSDYIIPVLYLDRTPPVKETPKSLAKVSPSGSINVWSSPRNPGQIARLSASRKILGRDTDILRLEVLLSTYKMVLVHGMGGSGKTTLLEYCYNWWTSTGWIEGFAYLDVEAFARTKGSMQDFLNSICEQLGAGVESQKEPDLVGLLQNRSYLLVLNSLESVPSLSTRDRSSPLSAIAGRLKAFLKAASNGAIMVIFRSRRDRTPLAEVVDCQCFLLSGLPVVASIELADQITFGGDNTAEVRRNGDDIELLSRIVILLEGFPTAIKLGFPALRDGRNTPEGLLTSLLYGSFKVDQVDLRECRFTKQFATPSGILSRTRRREHVFRPATFLPFGRSCLVTLDIIFGFTFSRSVIVVRGNPLTNAGSRIDSVQTCGIHFLRMVSMWNIGPSAGGLVGFLECSGLRLGLRLRQSGSQL